MSAAIPPLTPPNKRSGATNDEGTLVDGILDAHIDPKDDGMKLILFCAGTIAVLSGWIYLRDNPNQWTRLKCAVRGTTATANEASMTRPGEDRRERLLGELALQKEMLSSVEAKMANIRANAPICPRTGRPMEVTFSGDPQGKIRQEIARLETELAACGYR